MTKYIRWTRDENGIVITEQSHRGNEFGNHPDFAFEHYASNGVMLASVHYPEAANLDGFTYVRGSDDYLDLHPITGPSGYLDRVEQAFREYNEYWEKQESCLLQE